MSFMGKDGQRLKTPVLCDIKKKPKYEVARGKGGVILLTPEQEADIIKRLPKTFMRTLMEEYGVSFSFLQNFKRKHGLVKNITAIKKKLARHTKKVCEKSGYYDSLRGRRPSEACIEGTKRLRASGFHPMLALKKKNPRKWKKAQEKRRQNWLDNRAHDKRRLELGLDQQTAFHMPQFNYNYNEKEGRYLAKRRGYICGDPCEAKGERYTVYYTPTSKRGKIFERNLVKRGLTVKSINERKAI